jgi:ParB family chromosome partitioning protein
VNNIQFVSLSQIVFNRYQQPGAQDDAKIAEIADSLLQYRDNGTKGLLQVPTARVVTDQSIENGMFELAFGHHRYLAFQKLAQDDPFFREMPLIVRELSNIEMFELMAIENFKRRDISPIEEARTFHDYCTIFNKSWSETAKKYGKTDEYVRNAVRLLNLPESVQEMVKQGTLNKTDARDLLVLQKVGGEALVQAAVEELTGKYDDEEDADPRTAREVISTTIRMSAHTKWLDHSEDWFSANKKFPRKHLKPLTAKEIEPFVRYADGYGEGVPILLIDEIVKLIAGGMDVTDEAFPQLEPEGLARIRVLANPTPCEKCPFHAVLDGSHFCGIPLCKDRKVDAWEKKKLDDLAEAVGVPFYQKSDGVFVKLNHYEDADKKLWNAKGADLRLMPAKYMWNNFEGLDNSVCAVVVGQTAEKRAKKEVAENDQIVDGRKQEQQARAIMNMKHAHETLFVWEVASRAFASLFDGLTNEGVLFAIVNRGLFENYLPLPDELDNDDVIIAAKKIAKKADRLKEYRRFMAANLIDVEKPYDPDRYDGNKKTILRCAKSLEELAGRFELKLPKDFMTQAEAYQKELDAAVKEYQEMQG